MNVFTVFSGEIVEGSKDLDFAAATEDNESEVFPTSSNSKDGCGPFVSMVGSKRGIDNSPLIKDEELGGEFSCLYLSCLQDLLRRPKQ